MPFKITFAPNGKWRGGTRIPSSLRDISDLSVWTRNFIEKFRNLGKTYSVFLGNDNVLVGQEKANLVTELDGLVGGLLVFRRYLTENHPSHFNSLNNRYEFHFTISMDSINWKGHGWFSNRYIFTISNFIDWYNNKMMKNMKLLFKLYATAMEDNILTEEERTSLLTFIETVIFDILVVERILISTNITR